MAMLVLGRVLFFFFSGPEILRVHVLRACWLEDEILDDESTVSGPLQLLRMSPSYGVVKELPGVLEWFLGL